MFLYSMHARKLESDSCVVRFGNCRECARSLTLWRCEPMDDGSSLVTVCGDVCQTPESLRVSSPELAHLRTIYKCNH